MQQKLNPKTSYFYPKSKLKKKDMGAVRQKKKKCKGGTYGTVLEEKKKQQMEQEKLSKACE